ncbi:hypothetical protein PENTCL1PPCAC_3351 [Pristionchus entomophagus]|uniref:CRAL-TRIO domain-containing protein n=1 Tax=Pristionchus entomophagus TaxID=358040 RepID=A0AAV5SCT0_9BILA|nr:hypothetical protein PENTCL1PPCAC_3351 [Pristionchus entomophagus]
MTADTVPAKLTDADRKKVEELRDAVKEYLTPYYDTDFNLLRWLVGHDYSIELLKPKLINHLLLRKFEDWNLDGIATTPRNHAIHNYWKSGLTGEAGKTPNAFVNVEQTGANDYWGLLASHPTNELLKARVHDLESMLAAVMKMEAKTGERAAILYIMDLTGLKMDRNVTTLVSGALASISAFMSDHYVELIHSFVLVNVPTFIHAIWTLARPLLPERTRNKVKILGSNWRTEILDLADASVLPSYWNVDDSNVFTASIERGVPVPQEIYYKESMPADSQSLIVKSGKTGTIDMQLKEGQSVHYLLHGDGQFAFAIYFSDDLERDGEGVEKWQRVYPLFQKIPGPTTVPMKDSMKCPKTGTYRLWLSNEHAWFHTLKITHQLRIE